MNQIATLTEFLESGGLRLDYYDMGRRVTLIPRDDFINFELTKVPYPAPLQQQAWFALILSDPQQQELDPMIWFLRFPLDEQAKLLQAARDDFLHRLMENLGQSAAGERRELQAAIQDNPYLFQPKEERLAIFHARFTASLKRPVSRYYEHAKAYFQGELGWDQWSFVGYQGIADLAARIGTDLGETQMVTAIAELPSAPLEALCHCLENEPISKPITLALIKRARQTLKQPQADLRIVSSVIRGISQSTAVDHRNELILKALEHPVSSHSELLVAISGRAWECLSEEQISERFLQRLAENEVGQELFDGVLSDLLYMPSSRAWLQSSLRNPQRSEQLNNAISHFFDNIRQPEVD
ncbi:MAG: DUF3549 family protein [Candidatus Thiodiazotropha lotti]|uniref:DUF3549 domain-containing protein n=1 Tax=Candidatus Thiodiazotropha endoloripes TaxID=1818881 RepID=A0A1E2UIC1_9GAMM|nr:DUF3549 family protein [Candidatus Thiodiazotropha endoloripes]MCG7900598.1 DUF3549 family protein [Candidatus Thiodiazotropha weberae]MCG7993109.1 DUF3549 family protein [Candidatus Thiodiazotropha lotti]MCG7913532.1 DUF3549 family protein [Candidatus Thiodiazotropha weberae]MCG8000244.1 DUF3549 family protein [Candidatus Thiodiazotropha lotti]MCW4184771.1 DUF3549 family protein [Candidatus Thiodiazotropha weberae]